MLWFLAAMLSAAPSECEAPPTREVVALQSFAQKSGALSVGLDSVATWCFDSGGEWTAGLKVTGAKPDASVAGDCARALASCEAAKQAVTPELKALLVDALADLERPYLKKKYVPKRSGLADRPSDAVDCKSRSRPELFAQAQARMDLARLASLTHSEYANYKTWLFAEGLKCSQTVHAGQVDATTRTVAVDAVASVAPSPEKGGPVGVTTSAIAGPLVLKDAGQTPVSLPVGGPSTERERVMALPLADRWLALATARGKLELDRDYTLGFLASRELRDCRCPRPNPAGLAKRYAIVDTAPPLEVDEAKIERCEFCLQDAFAEWKARVNTQCALVERLSDFEVSVLQRSDDGNGLPPRCFEAAWARRDAGVQAPKAVLLFDAGAPVAHPSPVRTPEPATTLPVAQPAVTTPLAEPFTRAQDWAPIPLREDGRLYVRLFMSSACSADILPGPIVARTGDLLLIPFNARQLSVRSPCGGLAEVYWGREVKPRVSEIFARNQPLHLQFQPQ